MFLEITYVKKYTQPTTAIMSTTATPNTTPTISPVDKPENKKTLMSAKAEWTPTQCPLHTVTSVVWWFEECGLG